MLDLFPGGEAQLAALSDDAVRAVVRDPDPRNAAGRARVEIFRARTGTTVLVVLVDPSGAMHAASLGDCEAGESPCGAPRTDRCCPYS